MNPRLPLLAILASAVLATPVAAAECATGTLASQAQDVETIQRLEKAWLAAELRGETEVLDCLLDPGYRVIGVKTLTERTKADLLARVAANRGKSPNIPVLTTRAVINGAFATAYSTFTSTKKTGEPYTASFVDFYRFEGGVWRAVGGVNL